MRWRQRFPAPSKKWTGSSRGRPATVISQIVDISPDCSGAETYVDYALIGAASGVCAGGATLSDIFQIGTPQPDTPAAASAKQPGPAGSTAAQKAKKDTLQNPFKIPN